MNARITQVLVVPVALILLLTAGCAGSGPIRRMVARAITTDPERIGAIASTIAGFAVPEGYGPEYGVDIRGITAVTYSRGDGNSHLYLFEVPEGTQIGDFDPSEALRQVRQTGDAGASQTGPDLSGITVVETRTVTLRGQPVPVTVGEGINHAGIPYRQLSFGFETGTGAAFVLLTEPTVLWDQATVDTFIASFD